MARCKPARAAQQHQHLRIHACTHHTHHPPPPPHTHTHTHTCTHPCTHTHIRTHAPDADLLYGELCPRILARIERLASSDVKHADRCRLENYVFLDEALSGLAARVPALQQHWQVRVCRGVCVCVCVRVCVVGGARTGNDESGGAKRPRQRSCLSPCAAAAALLVACARGRARSA
jgi:hypothetical protein